MKKIILASLLISTYSFDTNTKVITFATKRNVSVMDAFNNLIRTGNVIVDFYAQWCGPCKRISPIFEQLSNECNNVTFIKVNLDTYKEIAQKFKVRSIPQLLFFQNGTLVETLTGGKSKKEINYTIRKTFG